MRTEEPFRFKQFHVHHHLCAHKVGTDGVLLSAWAEHPKPERILDVGSGSGLISLMLAQRYPQATFVGIEQHAPSVAQARQNLAESPFKGRGTFIHTDFLKWQTAEKFDLIVSNPPFFKQAQSTAVAERDSARRQFSLPHEGMLQKMASFLKPDGKIALVLPTAEAGQLTEQAQALALHLKRLSRVRSFPQSKVIRHLMELGFAKSPLEEREIVIRDAAGKWHGSYAGMTEAFYL